MELPSWLKTVAGYAPDIAAAIATGGTSAIASVALRTAAGVLTGNENSSQSDVEDAVKNATPEQLVELTKANNSFKVQMATIEANDKQAEHHETQETIRNGDNSDNVIVKVTRPLQASASLIMAFVLAWNNAPSEIIFAFLSLTGTYMGLRQIGKWKTTQALTQVAKPINK